MIKRTLAVAIVLAFATAGAASAGPILDDILNYMFMDQSTPVVGGPQLMDAQRMIKVTKDQPIGQTFVTGPETEKIVRVRVHLSPVLAWQAGEGVEMVLWDGPAKKVSLGRYTIWYDFRGYAHNEADFEIKAGVKPNSTYYFEISYVGEGDGSSGKIGVMKGSNGYAAGQGYLAGKESDFDVCFQTHVKRPMDRIGNLKKAFARFDLTRPELVEVKAAVGKEDFDSAMAKVVSYFETRKLGPIVDPEKTPVNKPGYDTTDADLAMKNYFKLGGIAEGYVGPDFNWKADPVFDAQGRKIAGDFDLNVYGSKKVLLLAYQNTGDDRYAKKFNDMMLDWFLDCPYPPASNIGGNPWDVTWTSLNVGTRIGHGFYPYTLAAASPSFTTECRFAFILSMADHGDTLVMVGKDAGGNWSFTQNSKMLAFAVNNPEYTNSKLWFDTASERLAASLKKDFLPDGVETESAPGYQRFAYSPVANVYDLLKERGITAPFAANLREILEREAEYFMYFPMPNGRNPFLGDWGDDDAREAIGKDSQRFGRTDMLYVSTSGKEGKKPAEISKCYPYAGILTMRSDWGDAGRPYEDTRYLMLHGVHYGAHGHADLNSINVYAYGRELLSDPGSYIYGSPEHAKLTTSPEHNVLLIDGQNQEPWSAKGEFNNWLTTPAADYISSRLEGSKTGDSIREVFYIRANGDIGANDYWIVRDTAQGSGSHSLEQRWHLVVDSSVIVGKDLSATTQFPDKGNLSIWQVDPSRLKIEESTTDTWRPRGFTNTARKNPTVVYKVDAQLPAAIDTVLFPFEGKQPPQAKLTTIEKSANGADSAFKIVQGKVEDLFVFSGAAGVRSVRSEKVQFDGERLFVRRIDGKVRSVALVNGTQATVGGKKVITGAKPQGITVVTFGKDGQKTYAGSAKAEAAP